MYRQGLMAGDYYGRPRGAQGDIFGSIFKGIGGALKGFITGGPIGAVRGGVGGLLGIGQSPAQVQSPIGATLPPPTRMMLPSPVAKPSGTVKYPGALGGTVVPYAGTGVSKAAILREAGVVVKKRRMNVTNAKALRRAIRRAKGFEKLAMRSIRIINPQRKGRFGGFKKRTRARA